MRKILIIIFIVIFTSCKSQRVLYNDYYDSENKNDKYYFEDFNAEEKKYSLLIFGIGYYSKNLSVSNCDSIIYNDTLKALKYRVLAKIYRLDNSCKTKIADFDRNCIFEIDSKFASKYKFIYIERDFKDRMKITYTNNHLPIM